MAQQFKDLDLSLLRLRSQLWHRLDLWPGTPTCLSQKKRKKEKKKKEQDDSGLKFANGENFILCIPLK